MHWSEKIADTIIAKNPNKEEYVCAAGISPSGSIHIGNFRDIATSLFVVKALRKKGKKARTKQQFVRVYDCIVFNINETMLKVLFLFHFANL